MITRIATALMQLLVAVVFFVLVVMRTHEEWMWLQLIAFQLMLIIGKMGEKR